MPLYSYTSGLGGSALGVQPVSDANAPTPIPEDSPVDQPEFLEQWITRLAQVRVALSAIMAQDMCSRPSPGGYFKRPTVAEKEREIQNDLTRQEQRRSLEVEEAALTGQINGVSYVASLRTTPAVLPPPKEPGTDEAMPAAPMPMHAKMKAKK